MGKVSVKSATKIRNAVNWLVASASDKWVYDKVLAKRYKFKINFITLTLPASQGSLTDNQFKKKMLGSFLRNCQYNYGLKNYVWKVEAQKNGNIHAHITTDTFIHYKDVARQWNKQLAKHGFIDAFEKKHGHRNPPSTEIKSVRKVQNLAAYLAKYLSKSAPQFRPIVGRLWGCNTHLSGANKCIAFSNTFDSENVLRPLVDSTAKYQVIQSTSPRTGISRNIGEIFFLDSSVWQELLGTPLKRIYDEHRYKIRHQFFEPPPEYWENDIYRLSKLRVGYALQPPSTGTREAKSRSSNVRSNRSKNHASPLDIQLFPLEKQNQFSGAITA